MNSPIHMAMATMAAVLVTAKATADDPPGERWPAEKAWQWHRSQPWLAGCNFLPSTAVNDVEMWQPDTFDLPTVERELGWARNLGFNTVRVFLNYVVWEADADGLRQRFQTFLATADKLGLRTMPVLFDDCNFAGRVAASGPQPNPAPGIHNSQWVSSPPPKMVDDRAAWPGLERYVKDFVRAFGQDRRVLVWDLYNEPGNGTGERSRPLVEAAFAWAREMKPLQPLTVGVWADFNSHFSRQMMELSDIVSFHAYDGLDGLKTKVKTCGEFRRPLLCTEWLARGAGSRFESHLPFFKENRIGCYNWGLAAGRTQTYYPWGSPKDAPEPKLWHHDIFRANGAPFKAREVQFIRVTTGQLSANDSSRRRMLVPTAEKFPVAWRYTLEKPAGDWFKPGFDDSRWKKGAAPFGKKDSAIARHPNTAWFGSDLWLRREFELPSGPYTSLELLMHYDEDAVVYLNGVLAVKAGGYSASYECFDIAPEALAALRPGKNVFAVHCCQTIGGQYLDLGLEGSAP
jgi:hypothetical protein